MNCPRIYITLYLLYEILSPTLRRITQKGSRPGFPGRGAIPCYNSSMSSFRRILFLLVAVLVVASIAFSLPPVRTRVLNLIEDARVRVRNWIFPQDEVVFVPGGQVMATVTPMAPAASSTPTFTFTPAASFTPSPTPLTPQPTFTRTPTATPLPASVALKGVKWETQNGAWNYCGPTNLAMLLSYWGWQGNKFTTGKYLKPFDYDLNVMPYEMKSYVEEQTNLSMEVRYGGTLAVLKRLIAGGFPVLIETGVYFVETATGVEGWMGHYRVITGYNEERKEIIAQDSYLKADLAINYEAFVRDWRAFNFVFAVAYTKDKAGQLMALLGDYADLQSSYQTALKTATDEMWKLTGIDQYYAWYNRGSSLVLLQDYQGAAEAYDEAFKLYARLPEDRRPWRMIWHQTGPYYAYYFSGRYQDVADLATRTLDFIRQRSERLGITDRPQVGPFIEETWVWRGRVRLVLGDQKGAIEDFKMALKYHPGFQAAVDELNRLGVAP